MSMAAETHLYNLVHITTGGEYKAPLVASQLFDQAECQATNGGTDAPGKVAAWVIGAMREYRDPVAQEKIRSLQERCPHIQIVMTNGISRLQQFPVMQLMGMQRCKLGKKTPVIYHCRGGRSRHVGTETEGTISSGQGSTGRARALAIGKAVYEGHRIP